ncbi:MAG TPA: hypothetical protein VHC19_00830 [Pirellulales bacterium]|nr:hypothetical protein [Pirellulales bacterium]
MRDGPSPAAASQFERDLEKLLREAGRQVVEFAYNQIEPEQSEELPHYLEYEAGQYRRLNRKTPNRHVATLFGKITLRRRGYRYVERDSAEPSLFPLEMQLGLVEGASPALADRVGRALAETGATQQTVLERLKREHGVVWGVKKLRAAAEKLSIAMEPFRRDHQAAQVIQWLQQAQNSKGKNRPVLAAGRDGITLRTQPYSFFEVASVATLSVYDRKGRRLGTVYLAYAPELGQQTMTDQLTALIKAVLRGWTGPLPRLAYLTDAGESETQYFRRWLRNMRHPLTGKRLDWQWIVDFYHAAQRLTTMGEVLFGAGREAAAWAARMRKLLKRPNGPFRVLHAAAAARSRRRLSVGKGKDFQRAYNYLRNRTKHMQYADFRRQGLPLGSGITEAACKTVFTQRLKLSGMRWKRSGAQTILNLRVVLLSGVWDKVYQATVNDFQPLLLRIPADLTPKHLKNAA